MTLTDFLAKLSLVGDASDGYIAACPAHHDEHPSLSVSEGDDGRILVHCFAGCEPEDIVEALGLTMADLFPEKTPPSGGCTLDQYGVAKLLPLSFLRTLGLQDMTYLGQPAVKIPYRDVDGHEIAVQFRLSLTGEDRFKWRKGSKACLYLLWRIAEARKRSMVVLCEGVSDTLTLCHHDIPAIGLPSATGWKDAWAPLFDGISTIYVVIEPDQGGQAVLKALGASKLRDRVRLITMPAETKDPSALYLADPAEFRARWQALMQSAEPWPKQAARQRKAGAEAAWTACQSLAQEPRILDALAKAIEQRGVVGEQRAAQLLYLIGVSRLLDHPVSAAVKGPSSAGKSYVEQNVLEFFPPSAFYTLTGMSERAFAYSEEPLQHRLLVIYEMAGLHSDFASLLVRSLLSEGHIRYETVMKTKDGPKPLLIEREGPTSLVVTTTEVRLHPENETRMLSVPVDDTPAQTRRVLDSLGRQYNSGEVSAKAVDLAPWHTLQEWLASGESRVLIPFAKRLVAQIPPVAVRLRRDVGAVLRLVQAHALLHQATRARDAAGQIVATIVDDYGIVRGLVADLIAEGAERTVSTAVRETVEAAKTLLTMPNTSEVSVTALARALKMDYSAVYRRVRQAVDRGFLKNHEKQEGRPARLTLGESLPEPSTLLPMPETLLEGGEGGYAYPPGSATYPQPPAGDQTGPGMQGCMAAGGVTHPPPPPSSAPEGGEGWFSYPPSTPTYPQPSDPDIDPADLLPADESSMREEVYEFAAVSDADGSSAVDYGIDVHDVLRPDKPSAADEIDLDDRPQGSASSNGRGPALSPDERARYRAKRTEVLQNMQGGRARG